VPRPFRRAFSVAVFATACAAARPVRGPAVARAPASSERRASGVAIAQYLRARLADSAGHGAAALDALRLALAHDPGSPQLRVVYAEALARAGDVDRAEVEARQAVKLAPGGAAATDAHLVLGKVLALAGRTDAALRELEAAAQLEAQLVRARDGEDEDAFDPEPWRVLARVRLDAGDDAGAAAACDQLSAFAPAEAAAVLRELAGKLLEAKKTDVADRLVRRAIELAPSESGGWKLLARLEEGRERLVEARAAWERALAADPDDPDALVAAGELALRAGDIASARAWLGQLLRTAADEKGARVRVAAAWLDAKQPAEALAAASGGDGDPRLLYLRGVALQQLRRWDDAAAAFAEVKPSSGDLYGSARVGLAYVLAHGGRPDEAVRAVRRGLEEYPTDPALLFALGEAYDRAGQRDAALAQMRAVLAVKVDHAEALNYLGYAYAEQGERLDEAQALLERALRVEPENGYYLDSLGWVYFKKGDLERAVKTLERAAALVGPEATILEHLGDTYRAAHRSGDAAAAYRRALEASASDKGDPDVTPATRAAVERKLRDLSRRDAPPATTRR
jgi:tetratricopeptide (TPR) repeat protein